MQQQLLLPQAGVAKVLPGVGDPVTIDCGTVGLAETRGTLLVSEELL